MPGEKLTSKLNFSGEKLTKNFIFLEFFDIPIYLSIKTGIMGAVNQFSPENLAIRRFLIMS